MTIAKYVGVNIEFHYAVALGTTENGESTLIEMTKGFNVRLVNMIQFLEGFREDTISIDYAAPKRMALKTLVDRAKAYEFDSYSLVNLNCKDFAYFVALAIDPPHRAKEMQDIQLLCNQLSTDFFLRGKNSSSSEHMQKFIDHQLNLLNAERKRLSAWFSSHL